MAGLLTDSAPSPSAPPVPTRPVSDEDRSLDHARWVVRASAFTKLLGLEVEELRRGYCRIRLPSRPELLNQGGTIHGGLFAVVVDHAAGTAASTMAGENERVVTAEYKVNILRPGDCDAMVTEGQVIKAGRRLVVAEADVFGEKGNERKLLAKGLLTFSVIPHKPAADS